MDNAMGQNPVMDREDSPANAKAPGFVLKRMLMLKNKKFIVTLALASLVTIAVTAGNSKAGRNLKVLPADISDQKLDSIMQTYNKALGVKCGFCHLPVKGIPDSLDYAADGEPMKEEARKMMRMTIELNKNYFYFDTSIRPEYLNVVTCKTCHQGEPFPPED